MNENNTIKKKDNRGLKILVVFLFLIIIGLVGFIAYDKFIKVEDTKCTENTNINTNKDEEKIDVDSMYKSYLENLSKRNNIKQVEAQGYENSEYKKIIYYLGSDNVLYVSSSGEGSVIIPPQEGDSPMALVGKKTDVTNVLDMFSVSYGNGGLYKLFILKTDGVLYEVDINNNFKLTQTSYKNVINILQVANGEATSYDIIDINGNKLNKD